MKRSLWRAPLIAAALWGTAHAEVPVVGTGSSEVSVGATAQVLGFGQRVDDPYKSPNRVYLFLNEARLRATGRHEGFKLHLELGLGGEDVTAAPSPGVTLGLLDLNVEVPLPFANGFVKVGQFKVPYGRERLTYSGYTVFAQRSLDDFAFRVGRDVGATVNLRPGKLTAIAGVFTGGGRDIPVRFLPEKLGVPLLVARVGFGEVDDDPYELRQSDGAVTSLQKAFFVNALYTKDSLVGHSSALNVKLADKSVLLDSNWNPYIGTFPLSAGSLFQYGGDAAVRMPAGPLTLNAEAELSFAGYSNANGVLHAFGGRAQATALYRSFEAGVRYSGLMPKGDFSNASVPLFNDRGIHELTPAFTYYVRGHALKLIADLPITFNAPLFYEPQVGTYVGTELPAEAALVGKGGTVGRATVVEGRLLFQGMF